MSRAIAFRMLHWSRLMVRRSLGCGYGASSNNLPSAQASNRRPQLTCPLSLLLEFFLIHRDAKLQITAVIDKKKEEIPMLEGVS